MNIIIPLGGVGKRFSDTGYIKPKPLVKVLGKEIIFWVLDSLNLKEEDNVYIPYNEMLDKYNFSEIVMSKYPKINLQSLPPTRGPSDTVNRCISNFEITGKVVLLDGDTWYEQDILETIRKNNDNLCVYFESKTEEPLFSYIKLDGQKIVEIKEKKKISNNANSGCYVFTDSEQLVNYINKTNKLSEVYISDVISTMLQDDINFNSVKVYDFHVLGTPQQIIQFSKYYKIGSKRFVFDLDNTLVTYPEVLGDYSTVKPIDKTIKYLRNLKESGHHITIYTARRMKTHRGNIGAVIADIGDITIQTLKEFGIPYDELVFGKPQGDFYIDDLMIDPKKDLNKELGFYMEVVKPRHFNELIFGEKTVIKLSNDTKLLGEAFYYKTIENYEVGRFFPKLYSSEQGKLTMEKIEGSNFSTLYVNEILSTKHLDQVFLMLDELHSCECNGKFADYYDYNQKLLDRFNQFDYNLYGVDRKLLQEVVESIKTLRGELQIIHGDLVFSNIMLTDNGDIKFIDVKGKLGDTFSIFGDPRYDYAKLYQSIIGYDEILLDKKISHAYKRKIINHFESKIDVKTLGEIKNITKSLLISLLPLHNESEKFIDYINLAKSLT